MKYKEELWFEYYKSMYILFMTLLIAVFIAFVTLKDTGRINIITWSLFLFFLLITMITYSIKFYSITKKLENKLN